MAIEEQLSTALDAPPDLASAIAPPGAETETIPTEAPVQAGASSLEGAETQPTFIGEEEAMAGLQGPLLRMMWPKNPIKPKFRPNVVVDQTPRMQKVDPPDTPKARVNPATASKEAVNEQVEVDASTLLDSTLTDEKGFVKIGEESYQVNFKTFHTNDDAKKVQANMAKLYAKEIDEARRGVVTDEALANLARQLGHDPEFIQRFLSKQIPYDQMAETVIASQAILESSARTLRDLATKITKGAAGEEDQFRFLQQWDFHRQWMAEFMGIRATAGRTLRAFQGGVPTPQGMLVSQNRMREIVDTYGAVMDIHKVAELISANDTILGVNKVVKNQQGGMSKGGAAIAEWVIGSLLSGFKTHVINPAGNTIMWVKAPIDIQLAAMMGTPLPGGTERVYMGEASAYIMGEIMGIGDAFHAAMIAAKTGRPYGDTAKFEMGMGKAISAEAFGIKNQLGGAVVNGLGHFARFPMERLIGPMDAFFKVQGERGKWAQLALRHAMMDAEREGLSKAETAKRLDEYLTNPSTEVREEMVAHGLYQTFQNPLGDWGTKLQRAINGNAGAKFIVPFMRTPTNLFKVGLGEGPIGALYRSGGGLRLLSSKYREELFPKPIGKDERTGAPIYEPGAMERVRVARARLLTGSALTTYVAYLAGAGRITGSGPRDPEDRANLMATGWRPRSVLTFDEEGRITGARSWDRMEPISLTIGPIIDIVEALRVQQDLDPNDPWHDQVAQTIWAATFAMAENTMNKTWMMGLHNLTRAAHQPELAAVDRYLGQLVNNFAGAAGARRTWRQGQDKYQREVMGLVDELKNATPYFSESLGVKRDIWGRRMPYEAFFLNPYPGVLGYVGGDSILIKQEPVDIEIQRLLELSGQSPIKKLPKRKMGVRLDSNQYSDWVLASRAGVRMNEEGLMWIPSQPEPPNDGGKWLTFRELIGDVLVAGKGTLGEQYHAQPTDHARIEMIKMFTTSFDQAGWMEVLAIHPELNEKVLRKQQHKMGQIHGVEAAQKAYEEGNIPIIEPLPEGPSF